MMKHSGLYLYDFQLVEGMRLVTKTIEGVAIKGAEIAQRNKRNPANIFVPQENTLKIVSVKELIPDERTLNSVLDVLKRHTKNPWTPGEQSRHATRMSALRRRKDTIIITIAKAVAYIAQQTTTRENKYKNRPYNDTMEALLPILVAALAAHWKIKEEQVPPKLEKLGITL